MRNSFSDDITPADFRYSGTFKSDSQTKTNGVKGDASPTTHYSTVYAKKLNPLRRGDKQEGKQTVGVELADWLIRAEDRAITSKMYFEVGSDKFYVIDVRNYKGNPELLVIETELRDNE